MSGITAQFRAEYARHRAAEGRGYSGDALRALPYLRSGAFARQWGIRARTFDAFVRHVLNRFGPHSDILDLGAGNGWLCHRAARMGHRCVALDMRDDRVDGLGAAKEFLLEDPVLFRCVTGSFEDLPFAPESFDVTLFNASLHYAQDLRRALLEASRVTRRGGILAILDSPFYRRAADGEAMVAEKKARGGASFGAQADVLLSPDFIEYLTPERLSAAVPELHWSHKRVRYPLWYELRPLRAWLKGERTPSRFDLWIAAKP
jgi:SAM-dependent methyltransferase